MYHTQNFCDPMLVNLPICPMNRKCEVFTLWGWEGAHLQGAATEADSGWRGWRHKLLRNLRLLKFPLLLPQLVFFFAGEVMTPPLRVLLLLSDAPSIIPRVFVWFPETMRPRTKNRPDFRCCRLRQNPLKQRNSALQQRRSGRVQGGMPLGVDVVDVGQELHPPAGVHHDVRRQPLEPR